MAFSYPLDRDAFLGTLPVSEQTFELTENVQHTGLGDGSILRDEIGPRLWRGRCKIDILTFAQSATVEAMVGLLQGAGTSFLVWRIASAAPQGDPDGSVLAGSSPVIAALPADPREISIGGLPADYPVKTGDMLAFQYGSSPTRYALHRVVSPNGTANGSGVVTLEVTPPIRFGASVSAAVELIRPYCKAVIIPGSVTPGTVRRNKVRGLSFDYIQTLR